MRDQYMVAHNLGHPSATTGRKNVQLWVTALFEAHAQYAAQGLFLLIV